jgi:hypothetical protein
MIIECTKIMGKIYNPNLGTKYQFFLKTWFQMANSQSNKNQWTNFRHDMTSGNT